MSSHKKKVLKKKVKPAAKTRTYILSTIIWVLLVIGLTPVDSHEFSRPMTAMDFISKHLATFTNLEFEEVIALSKVESNHTDGIVTWEASVRDNSRGRLQVCDKTSKWLGVADPATVMADTEQAIYWGMKYMSIQKARAQTNALNKGITLTPKELRRRMFASYNAGGVYYTREVTQQGSVRLMFKNQRYVDKCEKAYAHAIKVFK